MARLGPGTVGHDAWLADANKLVATMMARSGEPQLFLLDTRNATTVEQLTDVPSGVGGYTAISADGTWAAVSREDSQGPSIVVVPVPRPEDRVAATRPEAYAEGLNHPAKAIES